MKVPNTTLPGIPTDEEPLWLQIQNASKGIVRAALRLEESLGWPPDGELLELLDAVRLYRGLLERQATPR